MPSPVHPISVSLKFSMESITATDAQAALKIRADAAINREAALAQYDPEPHADTDEENDSDSPILDTIYNNGGGSAIVQLTNFTIKEFLQLYGKFRTFLAHNYSVGRGRRSQCTAKDALFMVIVTLKYGEQWDYLGQTFKMKGATFERLVTRFITLIFRPFNDLFVVEKAERWPMSRIIDEKKTFKHFKLARYATDVTFQQANRPSGNIQGGKIF